MRNSEGSINKLDYFSRGLVFLTLLLVLPRALAVNILVQHNDLARTGANIAETILTPANVNPTNFGLFFTDSVDAQVYAQPLYVENLKIGGGTHDVVFVCTESNTVYALDADTAGVTYWKTNLGAPFVSGCEDLLPVVGITSTPVIDLNSGTIYVDTTLAAGPAQKLHALDITTGKEKFGGPVTLAAPQFDASLNRQRTGLLLLNSVVYICFSSYCDAGSYHGFVLGYNATNFSQMHVFNDTLTGTQGGIWSGGLAPAVDTNGNIYIMTGNGDFDGTNNFGTTMIKLSSSLSVLDYATPSNWMDLSASDLDLGSGGPVLVPPHYAAGLGKDGTMYLADINNMGHVGNFAQSFAAGVTGDDVGKSPVYWQGPNLQYLFTLQGNNPAQSFEFTGSNIITTPLGTSTYTQGDRCGGISLSANGRNNGILWEIGDDNNLRAYDAVNFPNVLWIGSVGNYIKMNCPTIANGKVYVGADSTLSVYGLTNYLYVQTGGSNTVLNWVAGTLLKTTNLSRPWVTNPAVSPYTVVYTNEQMFYKILVR
jgi:hypothetical protein